MAFTTSGLLPSVSSVEELERLFSASGPAAVAGDIDDRAIAGSEVAGRGRASTFDAALLDAQLLPADDAAAPAPAPSSARPSDDSCDMLLRILRVLASETLRGLDAMLHTGSRDVLDSLCAPLDSRIAHTLGLPHDTLYFNLLGTYLATAAPSPRASLRASLSRLESLWSREYFAPLAALVYHGWIAAPRGGIGLQAGGEEDSHPVDDDADALAAAVWTCSMREAAADQVEEVELDAATRQNLLLVCLSGANRLFWMDVQAEETDFHAVYFNLLRCATDVRQASLFARSPLRIRSDLQHLLCRFYYHYCGGAAPRVHMALHLMLTSLQPLTEDAAADVVDPAQSLSVHAAVFIDEIARAIRGMRSEAALLAYVRALGTLGRDLALARARVDVHSAASARGTRVHSLSTRLTADAHSRARLHVALHALTCVGGPLYPTRTLRHAATATLDVLYPHGAHTRMAMRGCARCLQPATWAAIVCCAPLWCVSQCSRAAQRGRAALRGPVCMGSKVMKAVWRLVASCCCAWRGLVRWRDEGEKEG